MKIEIAQHDAISHFVVAKITEDKNTLLSKAFLSKAEEAFFLTLTHSSRQLEWLAVRVLLNDRFGKKIRLSYHPNGKPFLENGSAFVSVSHSGSYVALMWSDEVPVGIDVQVDNDRILKTKEKFLAPQEMTSFNRLPANEQIPFLMAVWTAKEAAFKILGEAVDFKEDLLCRFNDHKVGVVYTGKKRNYFFGETKKMDGWTLTWLRR